MIRKPLTTITINNDLTANGLKFGTKQLMEGFRATAKPLARAAKSVGASYKKGGKARSSVAAYIKKEKSALGSKKMREGYKFAGKYKNTY